MASSGYDEREARIRENGVDRRHGKIPIDPNGNLATKTEGADVWGYEWNANNELTRVTKNGTEQARLSYDPLGRRVERVAAGVTTRNTYDGAALVREMRGATTVRFVHGPDIDEPLAVDDGVALIYFHADALGSVVEMTTATGSATLTRRYDAWGQLEAGVDQPGYAFTGREWDPEIKLYYYRARYYDASAGTFISEDPAGLVGGLNRYQYVLGTPTNATDPSGLLTVRINAQYHKVPGFGYGESYPTGVDIKPKCTGSGACWKLEFVVTYNWFVSYTGPGPLAHELEHRSITLGNMEQLLGPLKAAEKVQYKSEAACKEAGRNAKNLVFRWMESREATKSGNCTIDFFGTGLSCLWKY